VISDQVMPEVLKALESYTWPGNVRELETAIERAVIVARADEIALDCLREEIVSPRSQSGDAADVAESAALLDITRGISFYDEVSRFEIELIRRALEITGGHQSRAAKLLGMNNTTLNSKIKVYNIKI
jgi:DNA-binding NtrC family response regulator